MDALKELLVQQNYYEDLLRRQEMAFCSFSQMDSTNKSGLLSERATMKLMSLRNIIQPNKLRRNINQQVNELK